MVCSCWTRRPFHLVRGASLQTRSGIPFRFVAYCLIGQCPPRSVFVCTTVLISRSKGRGKIARHRTARHYHSQNNEVELFNIAHKYRSETQIPATALASLPSPLKTLQIKHLLQLRHRLLRAGNAVANRARVLVNLIVVAALVRLVAKEVDGAVLDAADLLLGFHVLQAVRLVPARGEDVEGDLAADGVSVDVLLVNIAPFRMI